MCDPPRSQGDLNFTLFGIPVRVHPFFWLIAVMIGMNDKSDIYTILMWCIAMFVAILCHELGHAAVMRAYGFHPWITLYGMGGLTSYDQGRTYDSKGAGPLGQVLISLAGPVAGFLLAGLLVVGIIATGYSKYLYVEPVFGGIPMPLVLGAPHVQLQRLLDNLFIICVIWGIVNLMPIYPLDGGQVVREILMKIAGAEGLRISMFLSMIVACLIAVFGIVQLHSLFVTLMFGYLAFSSYKMHEAYRQRGLY
jgi:Zn-dependent protease